MKRIGLLLNSGPNAGGTFQYNISMLHAAASLAERGYRVVVIYRHPLWKQYVKAYNIYSMELNKAYVRRTACRVLEKMHIPMNWLRKIMALFHPTVRALIEQKCDLWIFPSQDRYSYLADVPALGTIHDLMHRYEQGFPEACAGHEYKSREKHYANMCKWSRGVLVDSEVSRRQVHESYGMPEEKIHILPFIPPRYIYEYAGRLLNDCVGSLQTEYADRRLPGYTDGLFLDFYKKYKLPQKFIFYPAQFWEHKNHINLIKAIAEAKKDLPDIKLVLVGSKKNAYEKVRKLIDDLKLQDSVFILGYVPDEDIPVFYSLARAMVMPSFFGPTNIPPLEAFEIGCPVAVSNVYAMPQQVGDAALLFDPHSVEDITSCIKLLWTDDKLCSELAARGKKRSEQWGEAQFAERLKEIIDTII